MNPDQLAEFRASTQRYKPYNAQQKTCKGPCKRRRSIGQFAQGDDLCLTCRRRAKP